MLKPIQGEQRKPNVLIIVADDMGYSDLGCFGSEIATPTIDSLAANGILFTNFHAAATCSPTRAMLLTGVDHHLAGMGNMYEFLRSTTEQIGKPGYEGHLTDSVITIAEVLQTVGYETGIAGKWHLGRQLVTDNAPIGRGFDNSWVLWSGWAEHYEPSPNHAFVEGNRRVPYPKGRYSTEWYTDKAIEFADRAIDHQKPFFLVASYTAPHWPLEAPADGLARQKGKYDDGFDALRARRISGLVKANVFPASLQLAATPPLEPQLQHDVPLEPTKRWDDLNAEERAYSVRLMEVHAAMIESMDQQVGRLLQHLKGRGHFENTMIVFLSDNGASSLSTSADTLGNHLENVGRPNSFVGYGSEWARASTGPLRLMKGYPSEGGIRVPAIIKLPGSNEPKRTTEFVSVLDIAPTVYELCGATYPQEHRGKDLHPLAGQSLLPHIRGERDQIRDDQYVMGWELFGRAALRQGRWKLVWIEKPFGASAFELYDVEADPGEARDLRDLQPDKYQQMVTLFEEYVRTNGVVLARPDFWNP